VFVAKTGAGGLGGRIVREGWLAQSINQSIDTTLLMNNNNNNNNNNTTTSSRDSHPP
jgi:hypothetical protein